MNWRKLIADMLDRGETEASIADKLSKRGAQCTQTTVNRLKSGFISEPRHSVGEALRALHADVMKRAA